MRKKALQIIIPVLIQVVVGGVWFFKNQCMAKHLSSLLMSGSMPTPSAMCQCR